MKDIFNRLGKFKFLFVGLFIGLTSARIVNMFMNPSAKNIPIWIFILPPILVFIFYKFLKRNRR